MLIRTVAAAAALALAACSPGDTRPANKPPATPTVAAPAQPEKPAAATATPAKPSGPARQVKQEKDTEGLAGAASVTDVHLVNDADVKLFSTAGGDPAINGLYTYLALYTQPDGWNRVFMIGDFNEWKVIEESATRVVLLVSRSWVEDKTGDIKTAEEKLILDIPTTEDGPLTVTPAT